MDSLGQVIDRRPALPADSACEAALAVFVRDEQCRLLAVVDGDRPVGLVQRDLFLVRMEAPGAADFPIRQVMDADPLVVGADEPLADFARRVAAERPAALRAGFVVTENGACAGVGDGVALIAALAAGAGRGSGALDLICAEVRAPIANAVVAAEGLARMRLPDGAEAHVETIAEAARAALSLLDVALDLQRAEAGELAITPAPSRLQEVMDILDGRWRSRAEHAGVTLVVSYDGQPDCAAMVDETRLLQVFDALIGHAMAHAGRGMIEASLKARSSGTDVILVGRVRDNSAAFDGAYLKSLFQGGASGPGGVGVQLGLVLAHRTVLAMAGRLEARANTGPGATMSFEIAAGVAIAAEAVDAAGQDGRPARTAHILVVDDNATNRMVVEALCEMFDFSTESVVDGVEAVEAAKAGRFDVILMDIKMPRMDGVTAAREIRRLAGPPGRVPIIALTANADPDEVGEYLAAGMRSVVEKPIKPERLMEALEAALSDAPQSDAAAA